MWIALLSSSFAHAGEIQVLTRTPVVVSVDGQILEYPEGSTTVTAANLAGGTHQVEIRSLLGKLVTTTQVDVPVGQQMRLQYADKALTVLGSGLLPKVAPTVVVQAPAAPVGMTGPAFTTLVVQLQAASFSSDKLELTRTVAANGWFTCAQLAAMLGAFDFDNDRVEAARVLAPRVVDPQNAAVVAAAFDFDSNASEVLPLFR